MKMTVAVKRRLMVVAVCGVAAAVMGVAREAGAQAARPTASAPAGGAATRGGPAPVTAANRAAAEAEYQKAKALLDQEKYAEALDQNERALQLDPTHPNALLLKKVATDRLAAGSAGRGGGAGAGGTAGTGKGNVLNASQISTIKMLELSAGDANLRGKIDRQVLEDFWQDVVAKDAGANTSPQAHDAFVNQNNFTGQVRAIKRAGDAQYLSKVTLNTDPASIGGAGGGFSFKNVQTYMLQNCATSECHSSEKGGTFRMIPTTAGANAEQQQAQLYTNFYIMATYVGREGKMIDRDTPDKSLFLLYSLAGKHPKVELPRKLTVGDAQYQRMSGWVKTLAFPQPNYGITYELPGSEKK